MVVKDILIYGTTNDGFEVYPHKFYNDFTGLDNDRKISFVRQEKSKNQVVIQYQIGDVKSQNGRTGHQFGFCLICTDYKIDTSKSHAAVRYLDGIHSKAFEGHLNIIDNHTFKYRRFSEVPDLDKVLLSIIQTINSDPPDFFVPAVNVVPEYISSSVFRNKEDKHPKLKSRKTLEKQQTQNIPIQREFAKTTVIDKKSKSIWKEALAIISFVFSIGAILLSWQAYEKVNGLKKIVQKTINSPVTKSDESSFNNSFLIERKKGEVTQIYFNHDQAIKLQKNKKVKISSKEKLVEEILVLTGTKNAFDEDFIIANNSSDLTKIENEIKKNKEITFTQALKMISKPGLLLKQKD